MVELRGDELKICLETRLHSFNQLFGLELMRMLRCDPQRVGIDRTIFLAR